MFSVPEYIQNIIPNHKLQSFLSGMEFWHTRRKLKTRLLFCYKDYLYDHELYSMICFLKKNYTNIDFIGFSPNERPRDNPGLSSEKFFGKFHVFKPDAVFTYEKILSPSEVDYVVSSGIKLVTNTCGFNSFAYGGTKSQVDAIAQLRKHDLYLVSHSSHILKLRSEGINAAEFPFCFDSDWFRPIKTKRIYDILFVGDVVSPLNKNRLELLTILSKQYRVALITDDNPGLPNVVYVGHTPNPHTLNLWFNQAQLVLGSDKLADISQLNTLPDQYVYYDDDFFIRQRAYPVMGSGACYLVERHSAIEDKFKDGQEIVLWDDYQDLIEKIEGLLKDVGLCQRIGNSAYVKCLAEHSTSVRVGQLIRLIENL
jgi:hypothetical protein